MRSPFPGVDPYLEDQSYWPDFHTRFLNYWCEALAERLPDHYEARLDEWLSLVNLDDNEARLIRPDIAVERQSQGPFSGTATAAVSGALILEPVSIPLAMFDEEKHGYIQILHRPDKSLVAILELLSPANKSADGFPIYCDRRSKLLWRNIHVVELDLLLSGTRPPMRRPLPTGNYYAFVSRAERRPKCDVYSWMIRDRLPVIPIPLKQPDPDVTIDLASIFQIAFERGRYARSIDYVRPLGLPFDADTKTWAMELTRH